VKTYTVKTPLKHDEEDCKVGSTIELSEAAAAPLLAIKAVAPVTKADDTKADDTKADDTKADDTKAVKG